MAKKATKKEIKEVSLSELKPFPDNPNTHPKEQIDSLIRSMDKYGQYYPIIVDENMLMLCGHGKKMALEQMGETKALVTILYGLSQKDKQKLVLEDNKIQQMSAIDYSAVEDMIRSIGEHDIIGFSEDYLSTLFNEVAIDNQGVDFGIPTSQVNYAPQASQEQQQVQSEARNSFEDGMSSQAPSAASMPSHEEIQHGYVPQEQVPVATPAASQHRIIVCPHCGKEIEV